MAWDDIDIQELLVKPLSTNRPSRQQPIQKFRPPRAAIQSLKDPKFGIPLTPLFAMDTFNEVDSLIEGLPLTNPKLKPKL